MPGHIIVLGDSTSHGGKVVSASPVSTINGKGIARVGDMVSCPIHGHGICAIVLGDTTCLIDDMPVARAGDKTACGAELIPTQALMADKC
jgi:uncharacterized Zn-binding protein involved in type VI secretion